MYCGRNQELPLLGPSVGVLARTLYFLQAWLLTSQVGSKHTTDSLWLKRVGRADCEKETKTKRVQQGEDGVIGNSAGPVVRSLPLSPGSVTSL